MKKLHIGIIALFGFTTLFANAQKLPNKQTISIYAPTGIKIDGKTDEWNNKYEAYNDNVALFYTVANDDDNIYLVIHSNNSLIIRKIMNNGILVTLNALAKKEKDGITILYPVIGAEEKKMMLKNMPAAMAVPIKANESEADYFKHRDSLSAIMDKKNMALLKLMKVTGIKEITVPMVSVYNQQAIKIAALPGNHVFDYELAIPIKYLGQLNDNQTIYYNVKLPGPPLTGKEGVKHFYGPNATIGEGGVDYRSLDVSTDFWGEYTLAKKP